MIPVGSRASNRRINFPAPIQVRSKQRETVSAHLQSLARRRLVEYRLRSVGIARLSILSKTNSRQRALTVFMTPLPPGARHIHKAQLLWAVVSRTTRSPRCHTQETSGVPRPHHFPHCLAVAHPPPCQLKRKLVYRYGKLPQPQQPYAAVKPSLLSAQSLLTQQHQKGTHPHHSNLSPGHLLSHANLPPWDHPSQTITARFQWRPQQTA